MIIKCLALWQPWASLVVHGFKWIETRPMYASHRGITGIHATQDNSAFKKANEHLFYQEPFFSRLKSAGYDTFEQLPRGAVIGAINITAFKKMIIGRAPAHPMAEMDIDPYAKDAVSSIERSFGNYQAGRYGIFYNEIYQFKTTFPAKGKQTMLFDVDVPDELLETAKIIIKP